MKSVRITGGPDQRSIKIVDASNGAPITGWTSIELSITPSGSFCAVTQVFKVASIDIEAPVDVVKVNPVKIPRFIDEKALPKTPEPHSEWPWPTKQK